MIGFSNVHGKRKEKKQEGERKRIEGKKIFLLLTISFYLPNFLIYNCINYNTILKDFYKKKMVDVERFCP